MAEPMIRFKRDDGSNFPSYEKATFGAVIVPYNKKNTGTSEYPVLTSSKEGLQFQDDHFGRIQLHDVSDYNVIPRGYCTYRNRSDDKRFTFNLNEIADEGIVSKFYPVFSFKKTDSHYMTMLLNNSSTIKRKLSVLAVGTSQVVLSFTALKTLELILPCLEEQQKIASFFAELDEVIQTSEAEVAALEKQKKGAMQKIFSQEVRFKMDDGSDYPEWEAKKLEDVVDILDGRRKPLESGQRVAGPYPYYGASGIIDYVEDYIFDDEIILLSEDGANIIDRNYRVSFIARGKVWVNNHAHVLKAKTGNVNNFICEQLETFDYRKYNSGGAQPKLNQATCRGLILKMPVEEEQQKIADFLSDFDTAIDLAKQELEKWKLLKKGLMQQMFV